MYRLPGEEEEEEGQGIWRGRMRDEREHSECVCIAEADMQAGSPAASCWLSPPGWAKDTKGPSPYYTPAHMQHADT